MLLAVHMIVATPGRILDLMNKELVKTDACKVLVLDEVCTGSTATAAQALAYYYSAHLEFVEQITV